MIFCDTSIIAKFYVEETESEEVRRRLRGDGGVFLSELAQAELMSVFHRRLREKKWTHEEFVTAVNQVTHDDLDGFLRWLPLDRSTTKGAAQIFATLPETVFLRASDCLHLVTALQHQFSEIYTYDAHQAAAAEVLGLTAMTI